MGLKLGANVRFPACLTIRWRGHEGQLRVDLSSSMVASATAGVGAKPGIQSGRGELLSRVNKPSFADARARGEVAPTAVVRIPADVWLGSTPLRPLPVGRLRPFKGGPCQTGPSWRQKIFAREL
jgi:hypothetical protein